MQTVQMKRQRKTNRGAIRGSARDRKAAMWNVYLREKKSLLRKHRGEYAWIVGEKIVGVYSDRAVLCREMLNRGMGGKGIIVKIEDEEAPTWDIPSPEIEQEFAGRLRQ